MELQLVTFEQAKSLKELGFPQNIKHDYTYALDGQFFSMLSQVAVCIAPTLNLVAKWLREEKDFDIEPHREGDKYTLLYTWFDNRINGYNVEYIDDIISGECKCFEFNTYEEALSAGIDKAIEILSNKI